MSNETLVGTRELNAACRAAVKLHIQYGSDAYSMTAQEWGVDYADLRDLADQYGDVGPAFIAGFESAVLVLTRKELVEEAAAMTTDEVVELTRESAENLAQIEAERSGR